VGIRSHKYRINFKYSEVALMVPSGAKSAILPGFLLAADADANALEDPTSL
jgi:hypothetical protein